LITQAWKPLPGSRRGDPSGWRTNYNTHRPWLLSLDTCGWRHWRGGGATEGRRTLDQKVTGSNNDPVEA